MEWSFTVHLYSIMTNWKFFEPLGVKSECKNYVCSDLHTNATANAKCLWDSGNLISRCNFNTQLPYGIREINCAVLFRAHHMIYPFWRPDTTSCTPGDISWACICPGSRWLFEWASLAPPLLRSTVCTTVVQSRHVRAKMTANFPRKNYASRSIVR